MMIEDSIKFKDQEFKEIIINHFKEVGININYIYNKIENLHRIQNNKFYLFFKKMKTYFK